MSLRAAPRPTASNTASADHAMASDPGPTATHTTVAPPDALDPATPPTQPAPSPHQTAKAITRLQRSAHLAFDAASHTWVDPAVLSAEALIAGYTAQLEDRREYMAKEAAKSGKLGAAKHIGKPVVDAVAISQVSSCCPLRYTPPLLRMMLFRRGRHCITVAQWHGMHCHCRYAVRCGHNSCSSHSV